MINDNAMYFEYAGMLILTFFMTQKNLMYPISKQKL